MKRVRNNSYLEFSTALHDNGIHGVYHEQLGEEIMLGAFILYQRDDYTYTMFNAIEGVWVTFEEYKAKLVEDEILFARFNDPDDTDVIQCEECFDLHCKDQRCKTCTRNRGLENVY